MAEITSETHRQILNILAKPLRSITEADREIMKNYFSRLKPDICEHPYRYLYIPDDQASYFGARTKCKKCGKEL